jgi:hypothetical protein
MKRNLALILLSGSLIQAAHAQLLITEINSNGTGGDFWELTNVGTSSVDLGNYKWNDSARVTTGTALTIPVGTSIAAGESIVFNVTGTAAAFRTAWGINSSVQVVSGGASLGKDDAITLYNASNAEVLYLSYAVNGFARSSGIASTGDHAGVSAGGAATVSMVLDPGFSTSSPRYAAAVVGTSGAFAHTTAATTIGSPGVSGLAVATPTVTLTVTATNSSFSEGAANPASVGTVTRTGATTSALVVTLSSSDTTEATVPASVTIPIGSASATFEITAVNDTIPDGNKVVTLNASATASTAGTFNVTVQDDGDTLPTTTLQVGDIAFTTFNGDRDAIAFVALDTIPAGEVIHFTDSAWDGSAIDGSDHFASGEGNVSWTAPLGGIAPGTVVVIDAYNTTPAASVGSATGGSGISSSSETIYAYQGAAVRQPITFLAAISNATLDSIVNTGLTLGATALQVLPSGTNQAEYTGSRVNQTAIADYLALIGNVASNWTGGGTGDFAGTSPNATAFTLFTPGSAIVDIVATASTTEGNSGNTSLTFAVTRTSAATAFTVDYAVTGGTATSGTDFTALASGTLTFAAGGALSQNITLDILGDTVIESNETVIITLSNLVQVTGTAALGNATGTGTITNDDSVPVSFLASGAITSSLKSSITLGGSEIPAFDPASKRAFASSGVGIQVVNLTDAAAPVQLTTIVPSALGVSGLTSNDVSSITVRKGTGANPSILAAAIINSPTTSNGHVVFLNAATGALIGSAVVGVVPDHIAFTPDGTKLLCCNEGELAGATATIPDAAMGTVSIIAVDSAGLPGVVQTADFSAFDATATIASLKAAGVRFFGAGVPSTDFEPEYLAISPDGIKAMVTLQEANALAILDIATATFTSVTALGEKDFSTGRHDFSDRDAAGGASGIANPVTGNPVFGLYMPDAVASYQVGGQTYYVTSNEGDDRNDFIDPNETTTVSNASYDLDNATFSTESTLKTNPSLGRLTVSNAPGLRGDTDGDGDIDKILSYGGRSFSILDSTGALIFDSGDMIEMIVASQFPAQFDDSRSDNKGPEPEGVTVAKIGARTFAFVGLERSHMVLAFDVTNPLAPTFATGFQRTGDFNPEGMVVVEAADSPSGKPLLIVSSEVSNTLTVFEIGQPTGGLVTFAEWLSSNGYTSNGIDTDTDGDGLIDLVEYFFNQSTNSGSDNGNLPVVTMASGEKFLTFTTNNTVAGVIGVLQTSNDLGLADSWSAAVVGVDYEAVSSVVAGAETTVTVKLLGAAAKNFFRYSVTKN